MGAFTNTFTKTFGSVQYGSLLNILLNLFAFWSKDDDNDYYASLEDGSPYYSLTEKN